MLENSHVVPIYTDDSYVVSYYFEDISNFLNNNLIWDFVRIINDYNPVLKERNHK